VLRQRLIPSLLLSRGRLVKGVRFAEHRDAGSAKTTARAHNAQGADEILLVDIDAAREGTQIDIETVRQVAAECAIPVTVGGGLRSTTDVQAIMRAGADKVCLTTAPLDRADVIGEIAEIYGNQAVVAGIDTVETGDGWALYDHRSRTVREGVDVFDWARELVDRGAGEIRIMAVGREGTRGGYDLPLFERMSAAVTVPIVLEGGAGTLEHIDAAFAAGADGVAVGALLVFADNNLVKIKRYLQTRRRNIRD